MQVEAKNPFEILEDINVNNINTSGKDNPKTKFLIQSIVNLEVNNNKSVNIPQLIYKTPAQASAALSYVKKQLKEQGYEPALKFKAINNAEKQYVGSRVFKIKEPDNHIEIKAKLNIK